MADPVLVKTAEEFEEDIRASIATDTGISDGNQGAAIKSLAFAVGRELEHTGYQVFKAQLNGWLKRATGSSLDAHGVDWGLTRRSAAKASGTLTLTHTADVEVPAGTRYAKPATISTDRIVFETTATATLAGSPTTTDFSIQAVNTGISGNVSSADITEIVTTISGVTGVTNATALSGGQDQEDDDTFRARILAYIEGLSRGTPVSIIDGALNFEIQTCNLVTAMDSSQTYMEVSDMNLNSMSDSSGELNILDSSGVIAETVTYSVGAIDTTTDPHRISPIVRSGSPVTHASGSIVEEAIPAGYGRTVKSAKIVETPGNVEVYIDDGQTNGTHTRLNSLVAYRLQGGGTARDPGYRPAGITLNCTVATRTTVAVTATITGTASTAEVKTAVENYLNNRKLGETVYGYEVAAVISDFNGVDNIVSGTLTIGGVTFDGTSSADVSVAANGIVYAGTVTIS